MKRRLLTHGEAVDVFVDLKASLSEAGHSLQELRQSMPPEYSAGMQGLIAAARQMYVRSVQLGEKAKAMQQEGDREPV